MQFDICGIQKLFNLPRDKAEKVTFKQWITGINTDSLSVDFLDNEHQVIAKIEPVWNGHGWTGKPVFFEVGDSVYTSHCNMIPDKFGVKNKIGYTVVIKYLYDRKPDKA